jgi:hypothetical protein
MSDQKLTEKLPEIFMNFIHKLEKFKISDCIEKIDAAVACVTCITVITAISGLINYTKYEEIRHICHITKETDVRINESVVRQNLFNYEVNNKLNTLIRQNNQIIDTNITVATLLEANNSLLKLVLHPKHENQNDSTNEKEYKKNLEGESSEKKSKEISKLIMDVNII